MTDNFIFDIIEKFNTSNVVELDISRGDARIALKKAGAFTSAKPNTTEAPLSVEEVRKEASESKKVESLEHKDKANQTTQAQDTEIIKSPIVGTFFRSPSPDSPAYSEKGKKVKKGEPLCILEAMKMMNTLLAEFDCEIVEIFVDNGVLVEFDQPLFSVKKL